MDLYSSLRYSILILRADVDLQEFARKMKDGNIGYEYYHSLFGSFNVMKATAKNSNDKTKILQLMKKVGIITLNEPNKL